MPVRVPRHVARFLTDRIRARRKLLEMALLELHDIDNRLKMELLSLTSLVDADMDGLDLDDAESDLFAPLLPPDKTLQAAMEKTTADFGPYELIDLDKALGLNTQANDFDSDIFIERIEEPPEMRFSNVDAGSTNISSPPSNTTDYFDRLLDEDPLMGVSSRTDIPSSSTQNCGASKRPLASTSHEFVDVESISPAKRKLY